MSSHITQANTYSKLNLILRALLFNVLSICLIIPYSIFVVSVSFFLSLNRRHGLIRGFLRTYLFLLEKICLIRYQITGLENIPKDRTGVILSKHQSTWETFMLPLIFHNPAIILKRELLWVPFFGWGLAAVDPISINRNDTSSAMQQIITKGKKCLEAGRWILVFPEGTRIPFGKVGHYRLGGARLAAAAACPVIPIAHNAGRFWPKKGFVKQPGTVQLVIGPLIDSQNKSADEIMKAAKGWIETTMQKL